MSSNSKGLRVREFFQIEATALEAQYKVMETLIPNQKTKGASHPGEEGRYIEALVRAFLNQHLPGELRAVSGFILCPSTKTGIDNRTRLEAEDCHSSQLDIIIYDIASYPFYTRFEEFCIVPPEGVVGIISVKKQLYNKDIYNEVLSLSAAAQLCRSNGRRGPFTALFAFDSEIKVKGKLDSKIFSEILRAYQEGTQSFDVMINEVAVLGQTCVFKWRPDDSPLGQALYVGVNCDTHRHIPLQRLLQSTLSVYHDPTRGARTQRPGFVSFEPGTFRNAPKLGLINYEVSSSRFY